MGEHPANPASAVEIDGTLYRPRLPHDGLVVFETLDGSGRRLVRSAVEAAALTGVPPVHRLSQERFKASVRAADPRDPQLAAVIGRMAVGLALRDGHAAGLVSLSDDGLSAAWAWVKNRAMEIARQDAPDATLLKLERMAMPSAKTLRTYRKKIAGSGAEGKDATVDPEAFRYKGRPKGTKKSEDPELRPVFLEAERAFKLRRGADRAAAADAGLVELAALNAERVGKGRPPRSVSKRTLEAHLKDYAERNRHECTASRRGKRIAVQTEGASAKQPQIERIGQRVEIDAQVNDVWTFALFFGIADQIGEDLRQIAKKLRVRLFVGTDIATMCVVGMNIAISETAAAATLCLDLTCRDKRRFGAAAGASRPWRHNCVPEELVTDTGSAFIDAGRVRAALALGFGVTFPRTERPKSRAKVERTLGTIMRGFAQRVDGRVLTNFKEVSDEFGEARCTLAVDEFTRLLLRWILDVYHTREHEGLDGRSPDAAWEHRLATTSVARVLDGTLRRMVFGQIVERAVEPYGLDFPDMVFQSVELQDLPEAAHARKVLTYFDLLDCGMVTVVSSETVIDVPNEDPDMENKTLDEHQIARARLYRRDPAAAALDVATRRAALRAIAVEADAAMALAGLIMPGITAADVEEVKDDAYAGILQRDREWSFRDRIDPDLAALTDPDAARPIVRPAAAADMEGEDTQSGPPTGSTPRGGAWTEPGFWGRDR